MGLAFIDIAGFRQFQQENGHEVGDATLRSVAATIPVDGPREWASRYSGDAFAVVIAIAEPSDAERWADAARTQIVAGIERAISSRLDVHIGIAVGEPGWWPSDIYAQALSPADAALHRAITSDPPLHVVVAAMQQDG